MLSCVIKKLFQEKKFRCVSLGRGQAPKRSQEKFVINKLNKLIFSK